LLDALGISIDDVGVLMVNRADGRFDQPLRNGDVVTLIPPIGGGWPACASVTFWLNERQTTTALAGEGDRSRRA